MIVAERKPFDEIKSMIKDCKKVFTVGCSTCVAVCLAGGEKEVNLLNSELEIARNAEGNPIEIGTATLQRQCDKEFLDELEGKLDGYDAVISMACGAGIQFLAEHYPDIPVFPGVDTTSIGINKDVGVYEERCRACGTCVLGMTGGICPVTMCAKGLYNGPCGGTNRGSCELNKDQPCAWFKIHERLVKQDRLQNIMDVTPPTDWRNQVPRTTIQPAYKERTEEQKA